MWARVSDIENLFLNKKQTKWQDVVRLTNTMSETVSDPKLKVEITIYMKRNIYII